MMHPSTYLNKVLLGSRQGALQLWNIRTRWGHRRHCSAAATYCVAMAMLTSLLFLLSKLLFTFPGWLAAVTVLQQVRGRLLDPDWSVVCGGGAWFWFY